MVNECAGFQLIVSQAAGTSQLTGYVFSEAHLSGSMLMDVTAMWQAGVGLSSSEYKSAGHKCKPGGT